MQETDGRNVCSIILLHNNNNNDNSNNNKIIDNTVDEDYKLWKRCVKAKYLYRTLNIETMDILYIKKKDLFK